MLCRLFRKLGILIIVLFFLATTAGAESLDLTNPDQLRQKADEILEDLSIQKLIDTITFEITSFTHQLSLCIGMGLAVIFTSSMISVITNSIDTENSFEFISICLVVLLLFPPIHKCFSMVQEHIEAISGFMLSFIPTGVILHTASGNTLSAALMSSVLPSSITFLQLICVSLLLPAAKAAFSITAANSLCSNPALDGLCSTLKSIALWICGLAFTLFTGILSLQTILQSGADNIAMKGLKYSAAKLIPVAGGMISESMKTVVSGMKYIKGVMGISGILFLVYTLIPPLCYIVVSKISLSLLGYAAGICDRSRIRTFINGLHSIINILLALILVSTVSFIIVLAMFMATNVSV